MKMEKCGLQFLGKVLFFDWEAIVTKINYKVMACDLGQKRVKYN